MLFANIFGMWRSQVSVLVWGTRGREFESPHPDFKACLFDGLFLSCMRNISQYVACKSRFYAIYTLLVLVISEFK